MNTYTLTSFLFFFLFCTVASAQPEPGPAEIRTIVTENLRLREVNTKLLRKATEAQTRSVVVQRKITIQLDSLRRQVDLYRDQMIVYENILRDNNIPLFPAWSVPGSPSGTGGGNSRGDAVNASLEELRVKYQELQDKYEALRARSETHASEQAEASRRIRELEISNGNLLAANEALEEEAELTRSRLDTAVALLVLATDAIDKQRRLIECVEGHIETISILESSAEVFLQEARDLWDEVEQIKLLSRPRADQLARKDTLVYRVWSIYEQYNGDTISVTCGEQEIELTATLDYMKAQDHLNLAYLLAYDLSSIVNEYGDFTDLRVMQVNAALLENVSNIFDKAEAEGNYDLKQEAQRFINRLPGLIIPAVGQDGNSKVMQELATIPEAYRKKDYATVLGVYNRYERVLFDESIQNDKELLASIKSCVGVVLLYDLGNTEEMRGIAFKDSWLDKTLPNRRFVGEKLLREVVQLRKMISKPVFERAAFALAQRF